MYSFSLSLSIEVFVLHIYPKFSIRSIFLFSNKYNLKRHLDVCLLKNYYKCEFCEDTFSRNYLLLQHLNICKCKK